VASTVNFAGISSGIDTKAIIQATVAAQRVPITRLESRKSGYQDQISSIGKMTSALNELKSMMEEMSDTSNVLAFNAVSGDEDVLTATINGAASSGSYDLTITELARAEKDRSAQFTSKFAPVKAGTMTLTTAGDDPVDVTIEEGDTLADVVDKINASGAKVDASLVSDGTNTYLQVVATDTGYEIGGNADDALIITESYTGADGTELGMTQAVQAKNALFQMDGLDVEQRSNTATDVIADVTLELKTKGTTTLQIDSDREGTKEKIQAFVDKFNEILDLVNDATTTGEGSTAVDADPALTRVRSDLRQIIGATVAGISGTAKSLSQVGLRTTSTGSLEINTTAFDAALDKDPRALARLFTQPDTGIAAKFLAKIEGYTDSVDGTLGNRTKSLNMRIDDADKQITRLEDRLESLTTRLTRQFTAMEQALSVTQMQNQALTAALFSG
jgi:flagellar hook-associated protein 2